MKTKPGWFKNSAALVSVVVLASGNSFGQPAVPPHVTPGRIDPATGLPATAGGAATIDPTTGLPRPAGAAGIIDPATGLPFHRATSNGRPDYFSISSALDEARELATKGRYEEALQRYLWYRQQTRESASAPPVASALPGWKELGRVYPKANQALIEIRDADLREFVSGRGQAALFGELAEINSTLGEAVTTYALFKGIEAADTQLAAQCYFYIEAALVERGEYEVCARYCGNPQFRFETARRMLSMQTGLAEQQAERQQKMRQDMEAVYEKNGLPKPAVPPPDTSAMMQKSNRDRFVRSVTQLIEVLAATGRAAEAEKIRDEAVAALDDERLRSAISDAETRVRTHRAAPRPTVAAIAIHPQVVESADLFAGGSVPPSASVEHWAPAPPVGTKPDVSAIQREARDLAERGQYEEALQRHLWYHNHALEYEPEAQRGVRLSFALGDWVALGRKYPKAREALVEVRDRDLHEFAMGRGSFGLFQDVAAINEQWDQYRTTCRLFHFVLDQDSQLAKRCYGLAEAALVKNGEYELCFSFVGDGQEKFDKIRQDWERLGKWESQMASVRNESRKRMEKSWAEQGRQAPTPVLPAEPPRASDNLMIKNTRQLIEVLVGAGHKGDAARIQGQAVALLDNAALQSAVSDAERKIAR